MAHPTTIMRQNSDQELDSTQHVPSQATSEFYNRTKRKRESSDGSRSNKSAPDTNAQQLDDRLTFPWNLTPIKNTPGVIRLHKEIEEFVDWMVPNEAEHFMRLSVIDRITSTIRDVYPNFFVYIFGSFKTGLYLPTSDIDLVLVGKWDQIPFDVVSKLIERKNIAKPGTLQLLEHATVPIIKLTDNMTNIKVDISFNMTSGVKSVQLINFFKSRYPAMAKLIYVLKQFLLQRDLNEVYTGGLSSYALILMVVSFLQLHVRDDARSENPNLGVLLMEFFELYGRHFNYANTAISITKGGRYLSKDEVRNSMSMGLGQGHLCIQDPYNKENDVGKSSYGIPVVRTAFENAYVTLSKLVLDKNDGILRSVIQVSEETIKFRNRALELYEQGSYRVLEINDKTVESQNQSTLEDLLMRPVETKEGNDVVVVGPEERQEKSTNVGSTFKTPNISSENSSDSASQHTDTDFEGLECEVRATSPSGSSSSSMSISLPHNEARSKATSSRQSKGDQSLICQPENDRNQGKKDRLYSKSFYRNGGHYNNGSRRSFRKDKCDEVLDWRKGCVNQDEQKLSCILDTESSKDRRQTEKSKGVEDQQRKEKKLKELNDSKPTLKINKSVEILQNSEIRLDACADSPDGTSEGPDENFRVKVSKKKRRSNNKPQTYQSKSVEVTSNSNQSATNSHLGSSSHNFTSRQEKARLDKGSQPEHTRRDKLSQQPQDQSKNVAQNRFSCRAGQSKPKR